MTFLDLFIPVWIGVGASIVINVFRWALAPDRHRPIPVVLRVVSIRTNRAPRRPAAESHEWTGGEFIIPGVPACRPKSGARS